MISPSGKVSGDKWGESDTRFTYILLSSLTLLGRISAIDDVRLHRGRARELMVENLRGSMNFDGGFGTEPGGESHGGQGKFSFAVNHIRGDGWGGDEDLDRVGRER